MSDAAPLVAPVRRLRTRASSRVFGSTAVLAAAVALTFAYAWPEQTAGWNASAHFALVRSLADGTATIDQYRDETGDVGWYRGHYYAAKAPGLALYSLPSWLVFERIPQIGDARDRAVWALNFWACVLPAIALFLLVRAVGDRLAPGTGLMSAIALGLGTMVLPFSTMYFAHIPAAAASFAAFAVLVRERDGRSRSGAGKAGASALAPAPAPAKPAPALFAGSVEPTPVRLRRAYAGRPWILFAAGLLAGTAVVFEYPAALIGLVLGAYVLRVGPRLARGVAYAAGVVVGVLPLIAYHWLVYDSPFHTPYDDVVAVPGTSGHDVVSANGEGFFGVTTPRFSDAVRLLVDDRGLLVLSPLVLAGVVGLVLLWRAGRRAESLTCLTIGAALLVYNSGYTPVFGGIWGGAAPGPRLLLISLPFLMLGVGLVFRHAPLAVLALLLGSTAIFAAATVTYPRIGEEGTGPGTWWDYVRESTFMDTLTVELGGPSGWVSVLPFATALAAVIVVGVRATRPRVSRAQVVVAGAAVAGWGLLVLAGPSLVAIAGG
jgi:hypothetical protein